jgi:hypothetical protein
MSPKTRQFLSRLSKLTSGKPSAKNLNSKGKDAYTSAAGVIAVCEDG